MIAINLVDYRSRKILILNRRFIVIVCAAVIAWLIIAFFIFLIIHSQINKSDADVTYLDAQLQAVAGKLVEIQGLKTQKDLLLSRRKIIESLQASRPLMVNIFDNLARAMPDGVILTELSRKGDNILMIGTADSNYSISVLMENIQRLAWVKNAKLGELKSSEISASPGSSTAKSAATTHAIVNPANQTSFQLNLTIDTQKAGVDNATAGN